MTAPTTRELPPEPPYWLLQLSNRRVTRERECALCGSHHLAGETMTYRVEVIDIDFLYQYECVARCADSKAPGRY